MSEATAVRAAGLGSVSFAGSVAGMLTVTVDHGDGLRSTVSYLDEVAVRLGYGLPRARCSAAGGHAHDRTAGFISRSESMEVYVDPMEHLLCGGGGPEKLYLLPPPPSPYARRRDQRPHGRNFRSPHIAHLLAGEVAFRQFSLDRVLFVPAGSPWQKAGKEVSSATHRWAMTQLATAGVDYFEPDDREVTREGLTYTADTLAPFLTTRRSGSSWVPTPPAASLVGTTPSR